MRHRKHKFKLNRTSSHRKALEANIIKALIMKGRIVTTIAKAKAFRSSADKMVTLMKKGSLSDIRRINSVLRISRNYLSAESKTNISSNNVAISGLRELANRFKNRAGGYSRIIRLKQRKGDAAEMCVLEYLAPSSSDSE